MEIAVGPSFFSSLNALPPAHTHSTTVTNIHRLEFSARAILSWHEACYQDCCRTFVSVQRPKGFATGTYVQLLLASAPLAYTPAPRFSLYEPQLRSREAALIFDRQVTPEPILLTTACHTLSTVHKIATTATGTIGKETQQQHTSHGFPVSPLVLWRRYCCYFVLFLCL